MHLALQIPKVRRHTLPGSFYESLRFDGSLYGSALYAPRAEETRTTAERRFTRDVTPAVRVREVFAVFVPNERRRNKRDS